MAKIIGIFNLERKTGKTTTSAYLAEALSALNCNVLAIDADPSYKLSKYLEISADNHQSFDIQTIKRFQSKWHLMSVHEIDDLKLASLPSLFENYEFVIVDFPSFETSSSSQLFSMIESVIIPIECEYYGLDELQNTLIKILKREDLEIEGILLTKFDENNALAGNFIEKVKSNFSDMVFNTVIYRNFYLASTYFSIHILNSNSTHFGFADYLKLANEILENKQNGKK
jgi:chromosome partitioning protein